MKRARLDRIPAGVWAIGSDLCGASDLAAFLESSRGAQAHTLRRPAGTPAEQSHALSILRAETDFLAIHGHADLALAGAADAVIAGVRTLPLPVYRDRFPTLLRGASTHDLVEAEKAQVDGAEFLLFGPVWSTPEKEGILEPRGRERLAEVCALGMPVIAIGGIAEAEQVIACLHAGAHGVAVMRAARDREAMQELLTASANARGA